MILWLYLSNFTSEHTAELGLGQGIRMLGWVGTKLSFMEIKAKFRINLRRCWYVVRKSFHTLIAGFILEVHCRSSRKEKVINIHDISGGTVDEQACCFGCDP